MAYEYRLIDPKRRHGPYIRSLPRGQWCGILFEATVRTKTPAHRQTLKRKFWKKYGVDIDKYSYEKETLELECVEDNRDYPFD